MTGVPSDEWAEIVVAFVVRSYRTVDSVDLVQHSRSHLAAYKCQKEIAFVDVAPRNALGKVQRHMREQR